MKILLLTDADVFAGTERHIFDLARALKESKTFTADGGEVSVACPQPSPLADRAAAAGIPVVAIDKKGLVDRPAIKTLRGLLRSKKIDVIHAHNGRTALSAAIAVSTARRGRLVTTQHFLEPGHTQCQSRTAPLKRAAHHWVDGKTHRFIAISRAVRDAMLEREDAPEALIEVVPNGIFELAPLVEAQDERKRWNVGPDEALIVCAARLEPEKDLSLLITAMRSVLEKHPHARCLIAGEGSLESALQQQIDGAGLQDKVRLAGFVTDAASLIRAADIFVLPSRAEPFGLALLEAMALERTVIAARAGGPVEIVVEGETGLLVEPGEAGGLANAINTLLGDATLCKRMGEAGKRRFETEFTARRMTDQIEGVYRRAVKEERKVG